jgi:hypothetical protein
MENEKRKVYEIGSVLPLTLQISFKPQQLNHTQTLNAVENARLTKQWCNSIEKAVENETSLTVLLKASFMKMFIFRSSVCLIKMWQKLDVPSRLYVATNVLHVAQYSLIQVHRIYEYPIITSFYQNIRQDGQTAISFIDRHLCFSEFGSSGLFDCSWLINKSNLSFNSRMEWRLRNECQV